MYKGQHVRKTRFDISTLILIIVILILISVIAIATTSLNFYIEFNNSGPKVIASIDDYQPPTAFVKGRFIFKNGWQIDLSYRGENLENEPGLYYNYYTASFLLKEANCVIPVRIIDTVAPEITLNDGQVVTIIGDEYEEPGYTAMDNVDGDITSKVQVYNHGDLITYAVADNVGNVTVQTREVEYIEYHNPTIQLTGEADVQLFIGDRYIENGFFAFDYMGRDITNTVKTTGAVDTSVPGRYEIIYSAEDDLAGTTTIKRTINVVEPDDKVIYLTFDDGPCEYTDKLLETLEDYSVKATFFVMCQENNIDQISKIHQAGHAVGIHGATHDYKTLYTSEKGFMNLLNEAQNIIVEATGDKTQLMRFPGGSSNTVSENYKKGIMTRLAQTVEEEGYVYFDWNVASGDTDGLNTSDEVYKEVIKGIEGKNYAVVLMHDIKEYSVDAVEKIIEWGLENDYVFSPLTKNSPTCHHNINN